MSAPATTSSRRSAPRREEMVLGSGSVAWRYVIGFVLLAYGLAWAIWAALLGPTIKVALQEGRTPEHFTATAAVTLGMYAPALAAVADATVRQQGRSPSGAGAAAKPEDWAGRGAPSLGTRPDLGRNRDDDQHRRANTWKPMGTLLAILTFVGAHRHAAGLR